MIQEGDHAVEILQFCWLTLCGIGCIEVKQKGEKQLR